MEVRKMKKFSELTNGSFFMFPGDRRSTIKKTGFIKTGEEEYVNISELNKQTRQTPKFHTALDTEVLFIPNKSINSTANQFA